MKLRTIAEKKKKKSKSNFNYPTSRNESFMRYVGLAGSADLFEDMGWKADLQSEPVTVTQQQPDGTVKRIRVTKHKVILSKGGQQLVFKVSKGKDGHPVFTDDRETKTGAAQVAGNGPLPGEQYAKAGTERKMTATGWAEQAERLIGPAQVGQIFVALIRKGFEPG